LFAVAFLILWACFTGPLGPLGLLVGWLPAIFVAPFAAPVLAVIGTVGLGYGVFMGAVALTVRE
jgi:hypothetical protein